MKRSTRLIAAIAVLLALCLTLASCGGGYPYMKRNLSKYVTLSREDYIGIPLTLTEDYTVTEEDIDKEIGLIRLAHRELVKKGLTLGKVAWGDDAYIYYWGTYKKNGYDIQFNGGTNMSDRSAYQLPIGSGTFIEGFEDGLIGIRASNTSMTRDNVNGGSTIKAGQIVYLNVDYRYDDGTGKVTSGEFIDLRVDLADPGIFAALLTGGENGESFADTFLGKKVGDGFDFGYGKNATNGRLTFDWDGNGTASEKLAISGKIVGIAEETSVEVKANFPKDYGNEELNGVEATFHVVVTMVDKYTVPALTEEMVKEEFSDFDKGEEEFEVALRAYLRDMLEEEADTTRKNDLRDLIFEHLKEKAKFTGKYPKKALKEAYGEQYDLYESEYYYYCDYVKQQYGSEYSGDIEDYVAFQYGLAEDVSLKDYLNAEAKNIVREKLLLYSIIKAEGWDLTDAEYDEESEKVLAQFAKSYSSTPEKILNTLGEDYIYEYVLFKKAINKLIDASVITEG
jgi:FKBP-type peptidyl-prolyl cis-trans isomerase (trigger factor)